MAISQSVQMKFECSSKSFGEMSQRSAYVGVLDGQGFHVAEKKAVGGRTFEKNVQKDPKIIQRCLFRRCGLQDTPCIGLKLGKQSIHQVRFSTKVVMKIAGAYVDFVGNLIGRRIRLALLVEQQQRSHQDFLACGRAGLQSLVHHSISLFTRNTLSAAIDAEQMRNIRIVIGNHTDEPEPGRQRCG